MRNTTYLYIRETHRDIPIMPPVMALCFTLISSNYPCLEHLFMVPKVFEPLKFDCTTIVHHLFTVNKILLLVKMFDFPVQDKPL